MIGYRPTVWLDHANNPADLQHSFQKDLGMISLLTGLADFETIHYPLKRSARWVSAQNGCFADHLKSGNGAEAPGVFSGLWKTDQYVPQHAAAADFQSPVQQQLAYAAISVFGRDIPLANGSDFARG
jgi:hypothetical protein